MSKAKPTDPPTYWHGTPKGGYHRLQCQACGRWYYCNRKHSTTCSGACRVKLCRLIRRKM